MAIALHRPFRQSTERRVAGDAEGGAAGPGRTRVAAARGAWAIGSVLTAIARLIRLATFIIAGIIVAAIILQVVGANAGNTIVKDIHDVARTLVGPFKNVFTVKSPKASIALNWGLAALVWLVVGGLIASLITRLAPTGVHPRRRVD
jgi:hypothetical protein